MSRPQCVRGFGVAFLAGCLLTFLCMRASRKFEASSRINLRAGMMGHDALLEGAALPSALGLSPMALIKQTGSATATPDKLIVAVRHNEVKVH